MSLRIILNAAEGTRFPVGSQVSGQVELDLKHAADQHKYGTINLYFTGLSDIDIAKETGTGQNKRTHHYRSRQLLLTRFQTVTQPTFAIATTRRGEDGGTLTFPFSLQLPTHAEPLAPEMLDAHKCGIFTPDDAFNPSLSYNQYQAANTDLSQPLPSSFHLHHRAQYSIDVDAWVRYSLRAEVPNMRAGASGLWTGSKDKTVDIPLSNPGAYRHLHLQPINYQRLSYDSTVRTLRLSPSHSDPSKGLSFREGMRSVFKKMSLPSLDLRITFQTPDVLFLDRPPDQPLPFSIKVERIAPRPRSRDMSLRPEFLEAKSADEKSYVDRKGDTSTAYLDSDIPTPEVYLSRLRVDLAAHTLVRTCPVQTGSRFDSQPRRQASIYPANIFEYRNPSKHGLPGVPLPVVEAGAQEKASDWTDIGRRLDVNWNMIQNISGEKKWFGLVGEFRTANINRTYGLQWEVRLYVRGEEVRWRSEKERETGLGVWVREGDGMAGQRPMARSQLYSGQQQQQHQPPAYEQGSADGVDEIGAKTGVMKIGEQNAYPANSSEPQQQQQQQPLPATYSPWQQEAPQGQRYAEAPAPPSSSTNYEVAWEEKQGQAHHHWWQRRNDGSGDDGVIR